MHISTNRQGSLCEQRKPILPPAQPLPAYGSCSSHIASVLILSLSLSGDIISRLTSDTTIVSDLVSQNINIFLRNMVKATGVIVFMFSLSWQLSLVTFMGFPIIMLMSDLYGKYYKVSVICSF